MASTKLRSLTAAAALAAGVLSATSASAAVDMFLKVPTIPGESLDDRHANEIDVLSWSWGLTGSPRTGACVGDINLVKHIDSASSGLMIALTVGKDLGEVVLTARKAGKGQRKGRPSQKLRRPPNSVGERSAGRERAPGLRLVS